jgi:hypothetical protein
MATPPSKLAQRLSGGIPASALGEATPVAKAAESLLSARVRGMVRGELVDLPVLGPVWIQLMGHTASNQVESLVYKTMTGHGLQPEPSNAFSYDVQRYSRVLAQCALDPDDHKTPIATLEEWMGERDVVEGFRIDDGLVFACGRIYKDVNDRLNPLAGGLTPELAAAIRSDFEKKNWSRISLYGCDLLATWLLSGAVQLSSSPTPASSTGPTSAEESSK